MTSEKLPLGQDADYMTSYADGFFIKLDRETSTVRFVFYKKEVELPTDDQTNLPDNLIKNLMFEVRLPNSALSGLLDIADHYIKYRQEVNEEALSDEELSDLFSRYSEKLVSSTFDTSNPEEHDKDLSAKFLYYLSKRQAKEAKSSDNEQQPE